jgi:O-antigen/teichoic acid export membrane protein
VLNVGITLKKRTIFAPIVIIIALAFNVVLNLFLIPRFGIMGATVATLLSYVVFCGLRYWASNLFFKVRYEWGRVFTILTVGASIIGAFHLNDWLRGDFPGEARLLVGLVIKATLALSFPLLLFWLKFFDSREINRIAEIWQKLTTSFRRSRLTEAGG